MKNLADNTMKELTTLARELGLKGYSRLQKADLVKLLQKSLDSASKHTAPSTTGRKKNVTKTSVTKKRIAKKSRVTKNVQTKTHGTPAVRVSSETDEEQQIEAAKFAFTPPGTRAPLVMPMDELHEDIEALPPIHEPAVYLLPQKPGVLHAYWTMTPGALAQHGHLRLRLCHISRDAAHILEETPLPSEHGRYYFRIDPALETGMVYLQLGYYTPNGEFVSTIKNSIARLPRVSASKHTDQRWWVSDEDFRRMYQRAGGLIRDERLSWAGGASSSR